MILRGIMTDLAMRNNGKETTKQNDKKEGTKK